MQHLFDRVIVQVVPRMIEWDQGHDFVEDGETVVEIIRRTQSPRRDADFVAAYVPLGAENNESLLNVLELLAKQVNLMRVDEMNGMIRRLAVSCC